jgi:5'-nucleotidase/UDP-sugar diphosphatase
MARKPYLAAAVGAMAALCACTQPDEWSISGQDVHLTLLHTTDIHSRLLPYDLEVGEIDQRLGLAQDLEPFGGASRVAYLVRRERGRAGRSLYLDSGDIFQGAPIFNFFDGEPETRLLTELGADAMAIGNHEFDSGGENLYEQIDGWAGFPTLAANYLWEDPELPYSSRLGRVSFPYVVANVQGLRVGIIGLANLSSMNSIYDTGNRLGVTPLDPVQTTQFYVDLLRPQVDVVVVLAHMGLSTDAWLLEEVSGIDVLLGGHHHVVLNPPKIVTPRAARSSWPTRAPSRSTWGGSTSSSASARGSRSATPDGGSRRAGRRPRTSGRWSPTSTRSSRWIPTCPRTRPWPT